MAATLNKTVVAAAATAALLFILIALPTPATASEVCKNVECGKGKCVASKHSTVGFNCKCKPGWLQSAIDGYTDGNDFLPCVFPNCTVNLDCFRSLPDQPEVPDKPALNPCRWVDCGRGTCHMKSAFNWSCNCNLGYNNLNSHPAFPCFKKCGLGKDCSKVGAFVSNSTSQVPSPRKMMQI